MKGLTVNLDGAAVSFRRGAENLSVRERRVLLVFGKCPGATNTDCHFDAHL